MSLQATIRRKYNSLFLINFKLRQIAEEIIQSKPKMITLKDGVACFVFAKVYKTHGRTIRLAREGYAEDADMLIRSLFDAYLIQAACTKDETDETVLKFMRFDDEIRTKMFKTVTSTPSYEEWFKDRQEHPKPNDETIEDIESRAKEWQREYGKDFWQRWHSGKTTGELAKMLEVDRYFITAYSLQSQLIHSLPRVMNFYTKEEDGNLVMDIEPKDRGIDLSLTSAFNMLFFVVNRFGEHYKLNLGGKLKVLGEEWGQAIKNLNIS